MGGEEESLVEARLAALRGRLLEWVANSAYPLWMGAGIDASTGGYVEALSAEGRPLPLPRRVRVQPRQVYAAAHGNVLGWHGDVGPPVRNGLDYLERGFRRDDGLYRTLIAVDGTVLDNRALLYDQAFVLLGFAAAARVLGAPDEIEARALALRGEIASRWRARDGGFRSGEGLDDRRESNPHLHLLEACLAWAEVGRDPGWMEWADEIAGLALSRFVSPGSGVLLEVLSDEWRPLPGTDGRRVEPGHLFEWAWLLLRVAKRGGRTPSPAVLTLIDVAESAGVHRGVAVNALLDDLTVHDGNARFWPQTERLKAGLLAREMTGEARYAVMAANAAASMMPFLATATAGIWFDEMTPNGHLKAGPAPASTFYHVVCALLALRAPRSAPIVQRPR